MTKLALSVFILSYVLAPTAFAESATEKKAEPKAEVKKPENKPWLADLSGFPSIEEIDALSKHVDEVMKLEKDKRCTSIDPRLRKMIFLHFVIFQHVVNQRSVYIDKERARHWAHVFAMLLKESSGDTTNVTSMQGKTFTTYAPKSNLERWQKITQRSKNKNIPVNYQTNFGLTQLSADRLYVALNLDRIPDRLKEGQGPNLNTAVAVRRLIWFYQDFAQGRLKHEQDRIHHYEKGNPEYAARFAFGTSMALLMCGTHYMFHEGYNEKVEGVADLSDAMASIAYCKVGSSKTGYGLTEENKKCFAEWVTLCPNLNFDIALITPLKYFATRNATPVCEATFNALTIKEGEKKKDKPKEKKASIKHHQTIAKATPTPPPKKTLGSNIKKIISAVPNLFKRIFTNS